MDAPPLQFVNTPDGFSIAYTICGEGPPLLFMPQPQSHTHLYWRSHNVFHVLYERLAENFRLICYDSRGMGSSTRGLPEGFRIEDFQIDLEAVIEAAAFPNFVLLAQSPFCRVAVKYAIEHPERLRALVLWNADTGDAVLDGWELSQLAALATSNWDLFVDMMARSGWAPENLDVAKRFISDSITQADWLTRYQAWSKFKMPSGLDRVRTPTLLLTSANSSPYYSEASGKYIASRIAGARLELLDDSGAGLFSLKPEGPIGVGIIRDFVSNLAPLIPALSSSNGLSSREIEVLRLIAAGKRNQQIADELVISLNTVRRHVSNIFVKTGATNRASAAIYARDYGLA